MEWKSKWKLLSVLGLISDYLRIHSFIHKLAKGKSEATGSVPHSGETLPSPSEQYTCDCSGLHDPCYKDNTLPEPRP